MNDLHQRLEALSAFVINYDRQGKTFRDFWDQFWNLAGDLPTDDPDVSWRLCEIQADADDAGFAVPDERLDEVM